jgi:hypothetical protein
MISTAADLSLVADQPSPEVTASPGNRLMLAVLEEAIVTFQRGLNSPRAEHRRHFHEVDRWIKSGDTDWPFAFENICASLQIDPDYIRAGLRRLKYKALSGGRRTNSATGLRRERIYDRRGWRGQIG